MFSMPMRETKESVVEITDSEPTNLANFLRYTQLAGALKRADFMRYFFHFRFVYTDRVDEDKSFEEISAMLVLAEKYNVEK